MKIVGVTGLHMVTKLTDSATNHLIVPHSGKDRITTVQSVIIKSENSAACVTLKTKITGSDKYQDIMDIPVFSGETKIINVPQQLPEYYGMYASSNIAGPTITVNGVVAELG